MDLLSTFCASLPTSDASFDPPATLLAVSGGLDSVVMAHLFRAAEQPFGIAHVNFLLRGEESDSDAHFVQQLAARWGVPFHSTRLDAADYAAAQRISTQMAARRLRYQWFGEICTRHGYTRLALAHHLNDAVETLLLHLTRGTGLRGLARILPQSIQEAEAQPSSSSDYTIIRPLSTVPRAALHDYALSHHIAWREDRSNASDHYDRNFIRHHILPLFQALNPNFLHTAERTLHQLAAAQDNLDALLEQQLDGEAGKWEKRLFRQLPQPRHALQEWLRPYGFHTDQVKQLAEHLDQTGLTLQAESGWRIVVDRSHLLLSPPADQPLAGTTPPIFIQENDLMVPLPPDRRLLLMQMPPLPPYPDGRRAVVVDAAALRFPLTLRSWQAGDWFQPFGMGGKRQKLQDYFVNQKLTRIDKEQVWVLENGDGAIIWVLGHRLDERFRVNADTPQALKIGLA